MLLMSLIAIPFNTTYFHNDFHLALDRPSELGHKLQEIKIFCRRSDPGSPDHPGCIRAGSVVMWVPSPPIPSPKIVQNRSRLSRCRFLARGGSRAKISESQKAGKCASKFRWGIRGSEVRGGGIRIYRNTGGL